MEQKVYNVFKIVLLLLFIIFSTLFFASYTGYYEYENKKNTELTEAKIKEFEQDIKNGVNVDYKDYIIKKDDYRNFLSKTGSNVSKLISLGVSKSVDATFSFLIKFVSQK